MGDETESNTNSNLNSQELLDVAREAMPENTIKTMGRAVYTYRRWAERRQNTKYVKINLLDCGDDLVSLDRTLFKFYGEVHIAEGPKLTPSSLQVLRAGPQRFEYLLWHVPQLYI